MSINNVNKYVGIGHKVHKYARINTLNFFKLLITKHITKYTDVHITLDLILYYMQILILYNAEKFYMPQNFCI